MINRFDTHFLSVIIKTRKLTIMLFLFIFSGFISALANTPYEGKSLHVGAPECAHCLAMALLGPKISGMTVKFTPYNNLSTLETALLTNNEQIAQIDYPSLVSLISRGVPIIAISGEVNGGSDFVLKKKVRIKANDWKELKKFINSEQNKFTIGSQYGTVQNVDIKLALIKHGINLNKINFINIPFQGMYGALETGEIDAAVPVQPMASNITMHNVADHFSYLNNQPAGNLTNVVIVTKKFYRNNPILDSEIAKNMVKLITYIKTQKGHKEWEGVVLKYIKLDKNVISHSLNTLVPDYSMPMDKILAISNSMYESGFISKKLNYDDLHSSIKYRYLSKASNESRAQLGDKIGN